MITIPHKNHHNYQNSHQVIKFLLLIIIAPNLMKKVLVHGQRGKSSEEPAVSKLSLVHIESDNDQLCNPARLVAWVPEAAIGGYVNISIPLA